MWHEPSIEVTPIDCHSPEARRRLKVLLETSGSLGGNDLCVTRKRRERRALCPPTPSASGGVLFYFSFNF